uniref:Uncharacterized protein n=1 Tax=Romanomermis culicivorax TaxID=13658 RepID=A0A915HU83_ROMCU
MQKRLVPDNRSSKVTKGVIAALISMKILITLYALLQLWEELNTKLSSVSCYEQVVNNGSPPTPDLGNQIMQQKNSPASQLCLESYSVCEYSNFNKVMDPVHRMETQKNLSTLLAAEI